MRKTETFRKHHDELRAIVGRIEPLLEGDRTAQDPKAAADAVRDLFGKFSVHLALEDNALYPKYAAHADRQVAQAATRFQLEMGTLSSRFDAYKHDWAGPIAITRDPPAFVRATREILALFKARVKREEDQLYDLIDRAE